MPRSVYSSTIAPSDEADLYLLRACSHSLGEVLIDPSVLNCPPDFIFDDRLDAPWPLVPDNLQVRFGCSFELHEMFTLAQIAHEWSWTPANFYKLIQELIQVRVCVSAGLWLSDGSRLTLRLTAICNSGGSGVFRAQSLAAISRMQRCIPFGSKTSLTSRT